MTENEILSAVETAQQAKAVPKRKDSERKATSLDALSQAFAPQDIEIIFPHPRGGEDIVIMVKPLLPGERFEIFETMYGNEVIQSLNLSAGMDDETAINEFLKDPVKVQKAFKENYEIALDVCQRCIVDPSGITADVLRGWDEVFVKRIFDIVIAEREAASPAARFPQDNNGSAQ